MNGMDLNGSAMEVEPAHEAPISADKPSARSCSIFIKGFGPEACPRPQECCAHVELILLLSPHAEVLVSSHVLWQKVAGCMVPAHAACMHACRLGCSRCKAITV